MTTVGFVYDEHMLGHEPPVWHPERKERLLHIIDHLKARGLWDRLLHIPARRAELEDLARVHAAHHIELIRSSGESSLDPDTFTSEGSMEAAQYAAGSVLAAIDACRRGDVRKVFCAIRPPGHHAEADTAMGFCLFNNIAVAARYAQLTGFGRVLIADFDAHHGNGTQHIFEEDDTVFYFSTHQYPYYPDTGKDLERGKGKGTGYTYNVQILRGSGNKEYLSAYQDIFPDIVRRFSPDIILVSAGYDIHIMDPHADIRVSSEGIRGVVRGILSASDCPRIFVLEGGYDLESLGDSVGITIEEMLAW